MAPAMQVKAFGNTPLHYYGSQLLHTVSADLVISKVDALELAFVCYQTCYNGSHALATNFVAIKVELLQPLICLKALS
eukprot:5898629-Pyramimonas_sp.AAC.1